jgi:hypothetical protein
MKSRQREMPSIIRANRASSTDTVFLWPPSERPQWVETRRSWIACRRLPRTSLKGGFRTLGSWELWRECAHAGRSRRLQGCCPIAAVLSCFEVRSCSTQAALLVDGLKARLSSGKLGQQLGRPWPRRCVSLQVDEGANGRKTETCGNPRRRRCRFQPADRR